jgi:pimeloyl-[acyl-carrier protein] methyl ester esterase
MAALAERLLTGAGRGRKNLHYFTASDGARIGYRDQGSGIPLVLLHGLMAHGGFFREQASLASDFRIISVDLRGHGASAEAVGDRCVERIALDIAELADQLHLEDAIGVGWSLGATVLWQVLATPAGRRFAGAVVIDMTARVRNGEGWDLGLTAEACAARSAAIRDDFEGFALGAGQAIFAQPVAAAMRQTADWASTEFAGNNPEAIAQVWDSLVRQDVRALLSRIEHPTLIAHGAQSSLYGAETADHLVSALPNAEAVCFDRSGHAPHLEQPEQFNRILTDFAHRLSCDRTHHSTKLRGEIS